MKMDSILHDEVLVARMKDLRIDRRHDFDREIVRADNADLQTRKPTCAFKSDAGRSVVEGVGFGVPPTSMTRAHEHRVSGRYRFLGHTLTLEASFQVGERDLFANVEHPSLEALDVEQDAAG